MPLDSYATTPPPLIDKAALAHSSPRVQSGARWFWWIAGLSAVNSVVALGGGNFNFVVGLGMTQFADGLFHNLRILAVIFDALAVAFFFFAGFFARKGHLWAFVVGGLPYIGDGIIFVLIGDWLPVAFHAYALVFIFIAAKELHALIQQAKAQPHTPPAPPPTLGLPPAIAPEPPQA